MKLLSKMKRIISLISCTKILYNNVILLFKVRIKHISKTSDGKNMFHKNMYCVTVKRQDLSKKNEQVDFKPFRNQNCFKQSTNIR